MSVVPLVRRHVRHELLRGSSATASRARLGSAAGAAALLAVGAALSTTRPTARDEIGQLTLLLPPAFVVATSMAVAVLDQTGPRGLSGPLLVLPVSRRTTSRLQRAPGLLAAGGLALVPAPAATVLLVDVGLHPAEAILVLGACVLVGGGTGLLCSVLATWCVVLGGRGRAPSVLSAPVAVAIWLAWTALAVSTLAGQDGATARVVEVLAGWPRILDVTLGTIPATYLVADLAAWAATVAVLSGAHRPDPGRTAIWWRHGFGRAPMLTLAVVRVLRARLTQVHLLMGACLVLVLTVLHLQRPDLGPGTAGATVGALLCAVCAVAARGLDGAVPLEVRWAVPPHRHVLLLVGATTACAAPVVVLGVLGARPGTVLDVAVLLVPCLTAACVGVAVGAVLAAPAGDPTAELSTIAVLVGLAFGTDALAPEGGTAGTLVVLVATTGALLLAVRAQLALDRGRRRGDLDTSRKGTR